MPLRCSLSSRQWPSQLYARRRRNGTPSVCSADADAAEDDAACDPTAAGPAAGADGSSCWLKVSSAVSYPSSSPEDHPSGCCACEPAVWQAAAALLLTSARAAAVTAAPAFSRCCCCGRCCCGRGALQQPPPPPLPLSGRQGLRESGGILDRGCCWSLEPSPVCLRCCCGRGSRRTNSRQSTSST